MQNMVTNAQKQIEGKNFDIRKNLLDYDDVLAKQRQIIYDRRDRIMLSGDIEDLIHDFFLDAGKFLAKKSTVPGRDEDLISAELLGKTIMPAFLPEGSMPEKTLKAYDEATVEEGGEDLGEFLYMEYLKKRKTWPEEFFHHSALASDVRLDAFLEALGKGRHGEDEVRTHLADVRGDVLQRL